ncbi:MAG: DUF721 domain-containing protein [Thermoleophilaceae bacterium]|nr:DUF721 domain-containing protein [Thermoleophilaceae bacterium]
MRRRDPFPLADALTIVTQSLQPKTALAEVQRVWPQAVGEVIAGWASPTSENAGTVTIICKDSVTAHHLNSMQSELLEKLITALPGQPILALKFRVGEAQ